MNIPLIGYACVPFLLVAAAMTKKEARHDFVADLRGGREYTPAAWGVLIWLTIGASGILVELTK